MPIDWNEMQKEMYPIKDFDDLCRRWREAFAYPFVRDGFNFTISGIVDYTHQLLGGDSRNRYIEYERFLVRTFEQLHQAGVQDIMQLTDRVDTRERFELFSEQSGVHAKSIIAVLKYLVYWFIPMKKPLSGLARDYWQISDAFTVLRGLGIRSNLDMLQQGFTPSRRKAVAETSGLPETMITELVNRADFSRMPWASKATISNIIGAGYESMSKLANANPEQLYKDFYSYGKVIGKNLKLGNEIENNYRIAKIVPVILRDD